MLRCGTASLSVLLYACSSFLASRTAHCRRPLQDSSGAIDKEELRAVVAKCGIEVSEMQLGELLKDADSDGSGSIEVRRAVA